MSERGIMATLNGLGMIMVGLLIGLSNGRAAPVDKMQPDAWHQQLQAMGLPPGLGEKASPASPIHQVTLAPLFHEPFACTEHPVGQLFGTGDALGTDCMIVGGAADATHGYNKLYRGLGEKNEDWYGWHKTVHAPFDSIVTYIHMNPVTNSPGEMGKPPASVIMFTRADGMNVIYAHIGDIRVKKGDHVKAGDVVALDSNNGFARNPHVHVGAYKGTEPFQIRWDLKAMGAIPALSGN
ncbi:M23 family metallopeptidase [Asaia bogorensis]|uniref:M23 family metallopeptidase n=1 Tax=Asaia bogorensis TaxID=91915 RepID=UPI001F12023A|nr:M23 family metallopeptidase [Asaia bogorensis]